MTNDVTILTNDALDWPARLSKSEFFTFVREERLFCATLAHLLFQRGKNLAIFVDLINEALPAERRLRTSGVDDAQLYLEFTYLRDSWKVLGKDNDKKRSAISGLLQKVDSLREVAGMMPEGNSALNAFFKGPSGAKIKDYVVYPGLWWVQALFNNFSDRPHLFRDICKFKWSFNIKPDLVVVLPGAPPICIEAKLESREGLYPAGGHESKLFDEIFGPKQGRVTQFELQRFMFEILLGTPCQQVVLSKNLSAGDGTLLDSEPYLTWQEVFERLDMSASLRFVEKLATQNLYLASKAVIVPPDEIADTEI